MPNTSKMQGSCTASKNAHRFTENYPKEIFSGKGSHVWDGEGKKYLDFVLALGPITLGWCFDEVDDFVCKTIKDLGTIFSLSHPMEEELAKLLGEFIPSCERVRYFHNGKDATEVAIRLARHVTGRELVLTNSYHGACDTFMAITEVDKGVPDCLKLTIANFKYGDEKQLKEFFDTYDVAAVIMELSTTDPPSSRNYLSFIRDICSKNGALFIADEIVSFPRYPSKNGSASTFYGIEPDLVCIGKGASNGFAWSALCGKEEYMKELRDHGVFASTTHGGNLVGVAATLATLRFMQSNKVPKRLNELGERFRKGIKRNDKVGVHGPVDSRLFFKFKDESDRWKLYQYCIEKGIFYNYPIFFSYSMTEKDIEHALKVTNEAIDKMDEIELIGPNPSEVFKRYDKKKV